MYAYLDGRRLPVLPDCSYPLAFVRLPGARAEVSISAADDGVGPLAVLHCRDGTPARELPVVRSDVDGVAVYRVQVGTCELMLPVAVVPLVPSADRLLL